MKKKTKSTLILVVLAVLCLLIFASCQKAPDYFDYSEDDLGVMGKLVKWMHGWVGNYGWTVVVFTVFLKILMLPLDIWQRYASRKSSLKMQQMQPIMESIDRRYGANTQRANEEKQKLYKKQGFSVLSSCLPMIVSMVVFFVMFAGLRNYSTYSSITNFQNLTNEYYNNYAQQIVNGKTSDELTDENDIGYYYYNSYTYLDSDGKSHTAKGYNETLNDLVEDSKKSDKTGNGKTPEEILADPENKLLCQSKGITSARVAEGNTTGDTKLCDAAEAKALEAVKLYYDENHESWLWIKNVWQPDTWAPVMQPYAGSGFVTQFEGGAFSASVNMENYPDGGEAIYNKLRDAVMEGNGYNKNGGWNGLMILPFASIGLSFLSMFISQRMERKNRKGEVVEQNQQQKATNTTMMIIMPLMMAWFGFIYTGAFAIYMVANYSLSIISTIALRVPIEKMVERRMLKDEAKNNVGKAKYMR